MRNILFILFLPLFGFAQTLKLNNNTVSIDNVGNIDAKTIEVDSIIFKHPYAKISAYVSDTGITATANDSTWYFMRGTFVNSTLVNYGFKDDTIQYQNGSYKYASGAFSFNFSSSETNTTLYCGVFINDVEIPGSPSEFMKTAGECYHLSFNWMYVMMHDCTVKIKVKSDKVANITLLNGSTTLYQIE